MGVRLAIGNFKMRHGLLLAVVLIVGCSESTIDPARVIDLQHANDDTISETGNADRGNHDHVSNRIAEMWRIQRLIEEFPDLGGGSDHFVFVGRVTEIRTRERGDVLVGQCHDDDCDVAILKIVETAASRHLNIIAGASIAVPVNNLMGLWEQLKQTEADIVFEYTMIARRETVWKYGC